MRGVRAFDFFDARLDLDADDFLPAADFMSVSYSSSEVSLNELPFIKHHTTSQNELYSRFCKLFSESSTGIPALLPCSLLPRQARGTLRKLFTKPHCTVHFGT